MRVITAPEKYVRNEGDIFVFLAGGITGCPNWQETVIDYFKTQSIGSRGHIYDHLILFNPRRDKFPIGDPDAAWNQIEWEFEALEQCDIFSMFFCGDTNSVQPICFYELGRNLQRMITKYDGKLSDILWHTVITAEYSFSRRMDVDAQVSFALHVPGEEIMNHNIECHCLDINYKYCALNNGEAKN